MPCSSAAFCDRGLGWVEAGAEAGLNHADTEALWHQLLEIAENERRDFPAGKLA